MKNASSLLSSTAQVELPAGFREALALSIAQDEAKEARQKLDTDAEAVRRRCRSLIGFIREAWPIVEGKTTFVSGWALEALCDHLEAVTRGEIVRLLITVPPGMSKSTTVGVFWPAWEWGPMGMVHLRYLATSYSGPNVVRDTSKMRKLVESEWYQRLWGATVTPTDKWGEKLIVNAAGGQREGRPWSKMTGGRGDRVIADDPHDTENAESAVQRGKTVRIFREAITDRLNDVARSAIVIIMQRLHESDVAGTILKLGGMGYVHLNLPMEFEPTRREGGRLVDATCRTYVNGALFFEDPRTEDGELLFPERFSRASIEGPAGLKFIKGAYAWAGQYQQRPTPREGGLFKREWFEGSEDRPSHMLAKAPPCVAWVRAWDFAGTEKRASNDPDASAGVLMGRTLDGRYIVAHCERFMLSSGDGERRVVAVAANDGADVPIRIPEDPGAAGKYMVAGIIRALAGYVVRVLRPTGSKETRATPFAIQAEHGNVWVVQGEWTAAWIDEVCTFPNGRFDDQVDASADGFNFLAPANTDSRYASAGPRRVGGVIEETKESELMRQATKGGNGRSIPSRRSGIM